MITKEEVLLQKFFHAEGQCKAWLDSYGRFTLSTDEYYRTSKVWGIRKRTPQAFACSIRPSGGGQGSVRTFTHHQAHLYHTRDACPIMGIYLYSAAGTAVQSVLLCVAHADFRARYSGREFVKDGPKRPGNQCVDCEFSQEDRPSARLYAQQALLNSLAPALDRTQVRLGYWSKDGDVHTLTEVDLSKRSGEVALSFCQFNTPYIKREDYLILEITKDTRNYVRSIEEAVNAYLKENEL